MVNDTFVIEEHTSDLAGKVTVSVLDNWEDAISNLLLSSLWVRDIVEDFFKINKRMLLLYLLLHLLRLILLLMLLTHHCMLLRGHHLGLWHDDLLLLGIGHLLLWLLHELLSLSLTITWLLLSHVVAWATLVAHWLAWSTLVSLTLSSVLHHAHVVTHVALTVHVVHTVLHTLAQHVLEEVLLHLLETSVLSLLMELAAWHPVLH